MATMSATMKQFTKGLKTTFEPMQTSLSNIEHALTITATREQEVETKRADKEKLEEEQKQTTWLKKLFGKKDEKGEGGGFFTKHWGKILTALAGLLLFLPKDFLKEKLFNPQWWKDQATTIGGLIAGAFLAKKTWDLAGETFGFALKAWMLKNMMGGGSGPGFFSRMFGFGGGGAGGNKGLTKTPGGHRGFHGPMPKGSSRLMPILGIGGRIVGWAVAGVVAANAINEGFFSKEMIGKPFGDKVLESLDKFVSDMSMNLIKEGKTKGLVNNIIEGIKDGASALTKGIIKAYKESEKILDEGMKKLQATKFKRNYEGGGQVFFRSSLTPTKEEINQVTRGSEKTLNYFRTEEQNKLTREWDTGLSMGEQPGMLSFYWQGVKKFGKNLTKPFNKKEKPTYTPKNMYGENYAGKGNWNLTNISPKELERRATLSFFERNPMMTKDNLVNMVNFGTHKTRGTRESSWTELNKHAQQKTNVLAKLFGGIDLTSGYRDYDTNRAAMIAKDNLNVYKLAHRLSKKERNTIPGSQARKDAVDKLLAMPDFGGGHVHGNAIDMRYPHGFGGEEGFPKVKRLIEGVLPGAQVLKERNAGGGSHLHIQFDPKNNPEAIRTAWNTAHTENREANLQLMGGGGGGGQAVINNAPTNIKQGDSTVLAGSYNAQDNGIWNEQVASSNRWRYG